MKSLPLPTAEQALPGRSDSMPQPEAHHVNGHPLNAPFPENMKQAMFAMGCFWGAERLFWQVPGVYVTAVGYSGGHTPNPTYDEVCSGMTGHAEVVRVVYDPAVVSYEQLLKVFWEHHDPCQGMRQGNDVGTQYRSAIYTYDDVQYAAAMLTRECYQEALVKEGYGEITTEIAHASPFYFAEPYHQQYLVTHPGGYCGIGGTGVSYP